MLSPDSECPPFQTTVTVISAGPEITPTVCEHFQNESMCSVTEFEMAFTANVASAFETVENPLPEVYIYWCNGSTMDSNHIFVVMNFVTLL